MHRITLTLERIIGGAALLLMLALLMLTFGTPVPATASGPIIIVATPRIAEQELAVVDQAPVAAEPTPSLPTPQPTAVPTAEPPPPMVVITESAAVVPQESQLVVEADGTVRLPGVDDWMANLPPQPTAAPAASAPLPPRGGCGPRCGWHP